MAGGPHNRLLVSALVLNYRSPQDTVRCVQALLGQTVADKMEILRSVRSSGSYVLEYGSAAGGDSGATAGRTFATASRRAVVSDTFLNRLSAGRGRVVLTASKASEVSEEREELGHGVFTYYLLEGLRGKADTDGDGIITVDEAYTYVSRRVAEVTGQNQHPVKKGEVEGQLVLGQVR